MAHRQTGHHNTILRRALAVDQTLKARGHQRAMPLMDRLAQRPVQLKRLTSTPCVRRNLTNPRMAIEHAKGLQPAHLVSTARTRFPKSRYIDFSRFYK